MKKAIAICAYIMALFPFSACSNSISPGFAGDVWTLQRETQYTFDISGMELVESKENVAGEYVDTHTDGEYNYSILRSSGELLVLWGNDNLHNSL